MAEDLRALTKIPKELRPAIDPGLFNPVLSKPNLLGAPYYGLKAMSDLPSNDRHWATLIGDLNYCRAALTIGRWGDQFVQLEMPGQDLPQKASVSKEVLGFTQGAYDHRFYSKDDGQGVEWEIILPRSHENRLACGIKHSKGLKFCYQPLEVDHPKAFRPDHIKGAYAVYGPRSGNAFGTGKLGVLSRPWVQNDHGDRIWAEQVIDPRQGTITYTWDKKWAAAQSGRLHLMPDYGYTTAGSSSVESDHQNLLVTHPNSGMTENGTTVSTSLYTAIPAWSGNTAMSLGVYADGETGALLDSGTAVIPSTSPSWITATLTGVSLSSGSIYQIAAFSGNTEGEGWVYYYDTGIAGPYWRAWFGYQYSALPSNLPSGSSDWDGGDRMHSQFVSYSTSSGGYANKVNGVPGGSIAKISNVPVGSIQTVNNA